MKFIKPLCLLIPQLRNLILALAVTAVATQVALAHPYASGVTNDNGTIRFILNEDGGTVNVVFENNTTNSMGVLGKGPQSFALGAHTSFAIYVTKIGNGTPSLISSDAYTNSVWNSPRGVTINQNPKLGHLFGRIFTGNSAAGGTVGTTWKGLGIYAMNADQTDALGTGTNAAATSTFAGSGGSGPWRMRMAPDNTLLVDDFSTAAAALWQFQPDLSNSNLVLSIIGQNASVAAGIHGDFFGTPVMTGSLAGGNLVLWTADSGMSAPATATLGPGTTVGSYNCIFRYDIGSGPLPWNSPPNYAYTMGLDGIPELRTEMTLGKDGKIIAGFGRANLSNPNIQILDPTGATTLYTSWLTTSGVSDPWRGENAGAGTTGGTYAGVRVSPDGRFLASVDINNGITLATLTNGIPDDGSIFGIPNTPTTGNSRGMDWDAANNIYVISSGQGLLRIYSLGITTTCITSNDFTGTNGTFQFVLPAVTASVVATTPRASQNYGTPIPGVFRISLSTNNLSAPVTVNFTRGGTAVFTNHYSINTNEVPNGVTISNNFVTFPVGAMPGGGNWSVDVKIIPTALPVSTNTLTVTLQVLGGANYVASAPVRDTVFIQNTGPQLLLLTAAATGTTMYRGVTNDYVKFIITRLGDTNGPGSTAGNVVPRVFTVTNVTYFGTASYPTDYKARAQRIDPAGNGVIVPPVDGPTAIVFNPGDTVVTCVIGNPVPHTDLTQPPVNLTIVANLTNQVAGAGSTNGLLSSEGFTYNVGTAQVGLTELDNAIGPEVVLWSNPLTNAADSVNWTLTFAATNFGPGNLPAVVRNYVNDATSLSGGGTNDFLVRFGFDPATDGVSPSPVMSANSWSNVLKMTVNKANFAHAGVNVYPQGPAGIGFTNFNGNYALRFNMYLSLYGFALNNPNIGSAAREFAAFGVNHYGTNCNWRTDAAAAATGGMAPTNSDGQWFAIDAGAGGITPADFDAITPPPVPNNANPGALNDKQSNTAISQNGVFKHPPFEAMNVTTPTVANPGGGEPVNKWVDVSVEINRQTNISVFINKSLVIPIVALTNGGINTSYTNGTIMLGYLDPSRDVSDGSAFVYYSNVRVVEVSPYILVQSGLTNSLAANLIVTQGSSLTFTSAATFATAPITNTWYRGTGAPGTPQNGVPTVPLQTNSVIATSMSDTLTRTFNTIVDATNYMSVFSDSAGSVTSRVVGVEVVFGPSNQVASVGSTFIFPVRAAGPSAPTAVAWYFNTLNDFSTATKLTNNTHYAGATTTNLFMTNVVVGDVGFYWAAVTNAGGGVISAAATLTVINPVVPASQTNLWGSSASFTVTTVGSGSLTYQWQKGGVNLTNSATVSGATSTILTLNQITRADATNYNVGVTNGANGAISSPGLLTVLVPPPTITATILTGGNVVMSFSTTNGFDNTNAFTLQSAPVVTGPYTNTPAIFTGNTGGPFQVTVPRTGGTVFYRLLHAN
jgi:hypothetical protein